MRPQRLKYSEPSSAFTLYNDAALLSKRKLSKVLLILSVVFYAPWVFQRTYFYLDKLPIWHKRIERGNINKMAFDFMLKKSFEKDKDMLEEYSKY